jgi:alkylhydroperoxidase family enzyme
MTVRQAGRLDDSLKDLALLAAAAAAGCSACTDAWYWAPAGRRAVLEAEIRGSALWRDGEVFTRLERLVMLYAEAAVMSPPIAAGDLAAELSGHLGEAGFAELTEIIALQTPHAGLD